MLKKIEIQDGHYRRTKNGLNVYLSEITNYAKMVLYKMLVCLWIIQLMMIVNNFYVLNVDLKFRNRMVVRFTTAITTKPVSSNPAHCEVYSMPHCY